VPHKPPDGHAPGGVDPHAGRLAESPQKTSGTFETIGVATSAETVIWEGRYILGAKLGEGATSRVYEAADTLLARTVAVKALWGTALPPGTLLAREARALAAVDHPGVVRVYGVYPEANPPFLVMERVRGRALSTLLAEGRLPLARALSILEQIAAALDALHAAGIVHGDVCPANVLVHEDDSTKLIEVGVAAFVARRSAHHLLGTPAYMAPERAQGGQSPSALAPASDVYSFGALCFQMLTGRLLFPAASEDEMLRAHVVQRPPMPSYVAGLSTELDAPLARALSKSPERRQASCTDLARALEAASRGCDREGRRLRVLIADDDEGQRMLLMTLVGAYLPGASIMLCGTGIGVLEAAKTQPSVAVLDLAMPEPSGLALVRRVREASPHTAIIIVTGLGSGADRQQARDLGVRRFLVKPFEVDELVLAIRDAASSPPHAATPAVQPSTGRVRDV
jgi:CheY-like chemotaxis protein